MANQDPGPNWSRIIEGVARAVEIGYTKEAIARAIGTDGSNLLNILRRRSPRSKYVQALEKWLDANIWNRPATEPLGHDAPEWPTRSYQAHPHPLTPGWERNARHGRFCPIGGLPGRPRDPECLTIRVIRHYGISGGILLPTGSRQDNPEPQGWIATSHGLQLSPVSRGHVYGYLDLTVSISHFRPSHDYHLFGVCYLGPFYPRWSTLV